MKRFHKGRFGGELNGGNGIWYCNFIEVRGDHFADVCPLFDQNLCAAGNLQTRLERVISIRRGFLLYPSMDWHMCLTVSISSAKFALTKFNYALKPIRF